MGIYGTTESKFVYDHGGGGEVTVALPYSEIVMSEPSTEYLEQKSTLTGDREFIARGTHWTVEIKVNLWKYTSPTPATKYATIMTYRGKKVCLWLHTDGNPFRKSAGVDALFQLKEVTPSWIVDTDFKDVLLLHFESIDPIYQVTT